MPTFSQTLRRALPLALLNAALLNGAYGETISTQLQASATVTAGCALGSGGSGSASFGTLNFGNGITTLSTPIDVTSAANAGSISLRCTPSTLVKIDIDSGLYAGGVIGSGRAMKHATQSGTLKYQLYQDSVRTVIWGNGSNGGQSMSLTTDGTQQNVTIYARLFSLPGIPAAGQYSDTVIITFTY